jgi:hypothetical protein
MSVDLNQEHGSDRRTTRWCAVGIALGLCLSLVLYWALFLGKTTRFDEIAIDEGDTHFAVVDEAPVHCRNIADSQSCLTPALAKTWDRHFLWLGNSQLHAINQRKPTDRSAPEILHLKLRAIGAYLVTFSEPNASPQEHLALASYLLPRLKPQVLLLPVVFDDFRETGLRKDIESALQDVVTREQLQVSNIGKELILESERMPKHQEDLAGLHASVQERFERFLTEWLSKNSRMWEARPEARGQIFLLLYQLRNHLLGIKPTTARKMIPGRFAKNWAALEATVALAKSHGTRVVIYVAPLRNDVQIPYDETEYTTFKARLLSEFADIPGVTVKDLERVVANELWGTKEATTLGAEPEYDFMHFRAAGHEALAQVLFEEAFGKHLGVQ